MTSACRQHAIAPGPAIFFSPHYDDVALSCGGTAAQYADEGHAPVIMTVFGGETLDELLTDFAAWKHMRWGMASVDAVREQRQSEDCAAAAILGCRTRWLDYPDAIYRADRYRSDLELFGMVQAIELQLVDLIVDEVRSAPEWNDQTTVYVPLGIGDHVDQQLIYAAGRRLAAGGVRVFAYEDCPYAMHTPAGVQRRLAALAGEVGPVEVVDIGATLGRRISAIMAYRSQVPAIFRFTADIGAVVDVHARRAGGSLGPAEWFWPLHPFADERR
jgi:LmbE family N-acetylglucosaminyl deacetylase